MNLRVIVVDDSSAAEGRSVVQDIGDPRTIYQRHKRNLGRVATINAAFRTNSYFPDSSHACEIEDDNYREKNAELGLNKLPQLPDRQAS
jgi:glycosyltransferase involved in cell wall biosynthesis